MNLHCTSETGRLTHCIIGYYKNFGQDSAIPDPDNLRARIAQATGDAATPELLEPELIKFHEILEAHGVAVYEPVPIAGVHDQLYPRDIGVVIGKTMILTCMTPKERKLEWKGIMPILEQLEVKQIVQMPEGIHLEGGDVVVDKGKIFVGLGYRSTSNAVDFLQMQFPDYEVRGVDLNDPYRILHLDCTFVPVGENSALLYREGVQEQAEKIFGNYDFIEVTEEEQYELAPNVLNLSSKVCIARPQAKRVNDLLRSRGIEVIEMIFDNPPKHGGSFRCCSLPLVRE